TKKSISSINDKAGITNYKIIVVDNGSKNSTYENLRRIYNNNSTVEVITTHENLGFAKGNNFGIEYAQKKYNPFFLIVMNNDVYLLSDNFNEKIESIYNQTEFSMLGPKIILRD